MPLLEKICRELGVEVGEIWTGNDGVDYRITKEGGLENFNSILNGSFAYKDDIRRVLVEEVKPVWLPKFGDSYFYPCPANIDKFVESEWINNNIDQWRLKNGLVCKTQQDAITITNKMLESIR